MQNITNNKGGLILIVVYLIISVLLSFSAIFIIRTINEKNNATWQKNITLAFYLAESGLDAGLNWLRAQGNPPSRMDTFNPLGGAQNLDGGTYEISIDPDNNNDRGDPTMRYKITSIGRVGDVIYTLVNEVQTDTFARYVYFTDSERYRFGRFLLPVWFIGGDIIEGPTQSNSNFYMKNNPVFNGAVKSAEDFITFYNKGSPINSTQASNSPIDVPDFQQGLDLGVEPIDMPSRSLDLRVAAVQGGLRFSGPTTVVLNADGTMNVTNRLQGWVNQSMALPDNGALFVEGGNLTVSGVLNGRLSMGSNRDVVIINNVTYADDPRTNPNSDDVLALIAERDVVISQSAPNDIEVDASIMALGNSFIVENWWQGPAKGTLAAYGGIIQRQRGPVGTFNPSTGQRASGYSKDYSYDPRLPTSPPPFYPRTGDYISLYWKE